MTPATIIQRAKADGVRLVLSSTGGIKAKGNGEAVNRWLPVIREHKAELLAELRAANDGAYEALPDPAAEARRRKVLAMLAAKLSARYALVTDTEADPVILALAIRGQATCEFCIQRDKYNGPMLLDLLERHGGTIH